MITDYPDALTTRITNIMNVEINLVKKSVEVGQESISVVQGFPGVRHQRLSPNPWGCTRKSFFFQFKFEIWFSRGHLWNVTCNSFLITWVLFDVAYCIVVPWEGVERAELVPAAAQLLLGIVDESTNICAGNILCSLLVLTCKVALVPAPTCGMANRLNCSMPMIENRRFSQSLQLSPNQCATHFPEPTNVDLESAQPRPPVPAAAPFTVGSAEKHFLATCSSSSVLHDLLQDFIL